MATKYTNSKELVKSKDYTIEGGKNDVCQAIQDLMADSREKGREQGIEQGIEQEKRSMILNMLKENMSMDIICRVAECDEAFVEQVKSVLDVTKTGK